MRNRARYSARLLCGTAMAVVTLTAAPAFAEGKAINIEPQSLATALREFASQSQRAILVSPALADNKTSQGVHDTADPELALAQLLQGTGLTWRRSGEALLIVSASDPQSGSAAGDGADSGTVQALIVTAQKREENIQDVPIAMSAFTQEALERSQVAGGPDLMTQVPNMTFTKTNFSSYSIQLRGIGTQAISATTDAAVAVAFNNTPFIRNRFFEQEFYDLQRVEVLRGPQGTLYGRNATAGVVNLISQKPKFTYEAKLSADVGNYKSTRLEGMLNIPLAEDKVALRVAGAWTKREGYATNEITGNPIDGRDLWSTRVSLRFTPSDKIDANLIWEHFQEDDDRLRSGKQVCKKDVVTEIGGVPTIPLDTDPASFFALQQEQGNFSQGCVAASMYADESFQTPNGFSLPYYHPLNGLTFPSINGFDPYASVDQSRDLRVIESIVDPEYRAKADLVELQFNVDLSESLTFTSETAYSSDRVFSFQDYNRFNTREGAFRPFAADTDPVYLASWAGILDDNGVFCDPQLGCTNRLVAADVSTAKSTQFSEEIRLTSNYDGAFNFSLGANFLRADILDKYYVFINSLTLWSAMRGGPWQGFPARGPYQAGVTDRTDCLVPDGPALPDPNKNYSLGRCTYIDPNPIGSLNDEGHNYFLSKNPYKLISYAVFGEAYYNITDALKLTAGLRWTVDKKEAPRIPSWVVAELTVGYPVAEVSEQEWREPTGRLTLDWKPDLGFTDDTLLYASYAHGYKAGGANPPPAGVVILAPVDAQEAIQRASAAIPRTFDPEFIDAFEVGAKNTLLDGRLTLNADAFYYDYKDYQISYITDRSAVNLNFDAEVRGLEVEADWRLLNNLRLGFKGGYEQTRVADGERAIDVMDRTAGNPDWVVVRPHPARSSNCILPLVAIIDDGGNIDVPGNVFAGGASGCEEAWLLGIPINGWDPATAPAEANNGEGFYKDLSGKELPNAPHYTATITADYTLPLPSNWLMTLHTDLYYQSEAWTRIFNTEGYDKLKAYSNINLAAIFTNEDAGWKVMAYVKNVLDRDSITGAFLNSDDTGLTTNVFLTEPRLFGLRVTKDWNGGPWWTGADPSRSGPYPFTVELGGQVQRQDAPFETVYPSFGDKFADNIDAMERSQHNDLDWGDGRSLKLTYRPDAGLWSVSAAVRYGRTNGSTSPLRLESETEAKCAFGGEEYDALCASNPKLVKDNGYYLSQTNWARASAATQEKHDVVDFSVGRDFAIGSIESSVSVGLRYANLESRTQMEVLGVPDWFVPEGWYVKYETTHTYFRADLEATREFKGWGPVVNWDGTLQLLGSDEAGSVGLDWSLGGGVLYGNQRHKLAGTESSRYYQLIGGDSAAGFDGQPPFDSPPVASSAAVNTIRSESTTAPLLDLSLGLSYEVGRVKVGAGYHWERYFGVLDVGNAAHEDGDRTFDGPYFKIAVGFGG